MASLDLKIEDLEDGNVLITWKDAQSRPHIPAIAFAMGFPVTFVVMMSIEPGHAAGEFLASVIVAIFGGWIPGLFFGLIGKIVSEIPTDRKLIITPNEVISGGVRSIPLDHISRVEYGERGEWDTSNPSNTKLTQIRIWDRDQRFIVVAENNWTKSVNHDLHRTIQDEITAIRKRLQAPSPSAPKDTPAGGDDNFGMPDY